MQAQPIAKIVGKNGRAGSSALAAQVGDVSVSKAGAPHPDALGNLLLA
ncbi:MAG TPA: hypothetical protein VFZ66_13770 [Herpetosiphonaceae bacterium]